MVAATLKLFVPHPHHIHPWCANSNSNSLEPRAYLRMRANLDAGCSGGVKLIQLCEILGGEKLPPPEDGQMRVSLQIVCMHDCYVFRLNWGLQLQLPFYTLATASAHMYV